MAKPGATQELFDAIAAHSSHRDYLDPQRDADALKRMRAALNAGANWRARLGPGERDAAFTAATQGSRGPLEVLLDHGVPLDHAAPGDGQLIHRAAEFSNIDAVRMLVERGVPPDARDALGRTPLQVARGWKHGAAAVPVLVGLMKQHGASPAPAKPTDDLRVETTKLPARAPKVLVQAVKALFAERAGGRAVDLLAALAEQRDTPALLAGIELVKASSASKPTRKVVKKGKGIDLVHIGDVELPADADIRSLVVTGNVRSRGRIANYEGCVLAVGGSLTADAIWSEGPLVVAGAVKCSTVFGVGDNDHAATINGVLATGVFVQLDRHVVKAKSIKSKLRVTTRADVPDRAFAALKWKQR